MFYVDIVATLVYAGNRPVTDAFFGIDISPVQGGHVSGSRAVIDALAQRGGDHGIPVSPGSGQKRAAMRVKPRERSRMTAAAGGKELRSEYPSLLPLYKKETDGSTANSTGG